MEASLAALPHPREDLSGDPGGIPEHRRQALRHVRGDRELREVEYDGEGDGRVAQFNGGLADARRQPGGQLVADVALELGLGEPRLDRPAAGRQLLQRRVHLRRRLGTEFGRGLDDDDFVRADVREPRLDVLPEDPAREQQNQEEDEKTQACEELPEEPHVDHLRRESGKEKS